MPVTLIATCPLCGLHFTNRALLELHVREDHPRPDPPEHRGRGSRAGPAGGARTGRTGGSA
jgi:hypothetical protein